MAQYDVYPNPSTRSRADYPLVVDMQSPLLSELRTRLVIPLALDTGSRHPRPERLSPAFLIEGQAVQARPWLAAPVDARLLREPVASLAHCAHVLRDAQDAVVAGV